MRSLILLTLSFSLLSAVRAASLCVNTCILSEAPLKCVGDVTCACTEDRQFTNRLLACVRSLCDDDDDEDEARTICSSTGPTGTTTPPSNTVGPTGTTPPPSNTVTTPTNTNTLTQPSDTTATNTPSDTQVTNTQTTPPTPTSTPPTQTNTNTRTGTTTPRSASTAGALPTAFVAPRDERITYSPADSWIDAGAESGCGNGARSSSSIGSAISFTFTGTAIWFFTLPLSSSGNWSITIDNLPAQTIGGANAQFTNPNGCNSFVSYQKEGLTNGQHTFTAKILTSGSLKRAASTMYFAGLKYQGANAVETPPLTTSSGPSPAIIGGAVGGAIGAIALIAFAIWIIRTRRRRNKWRGGEIDLPDSPSEHDLVAKATLPSDTLHNEKSYGSTNGGYSDRQGGYSDRQGGYSDRQGGYPGGQHRPGYASPYLDSPYGDSPYAAAASAGAGRAGVGSGYSRGHDDQADSQAYGAWQQQQQQPPQQAHGYSYPQQYAYGQYPAAAPSTVPAQYPPSSRAPVRQWSSHEAARGTPPPPPPAKGPPPLAPTHDGGDIRPAAGQRTPAPHEDDAYGGMEY